MKFSKRYREYMQGREKKKLPQLELNKLAELLRLCRKEFKTPQKENQDRSFDSKYPDSFPICDEIFFPSLLKEMLSVGLYFEERAKRLLKLHLSSGIKRYLVWFRSKKQRSHEFLMQEGKDLITYAVIHSIAMRELRKKYDKLMPLMGQAQSMRIEIIRSPWLFQLVAFYINMRQTKDHKKAIPTLFADCSLIFKDDKPMLSYESIDSGKLEIELTCPICLDMVFDSVSLSCGHIFCYMCGCSSASVTTVDGLKAADPKAKCPLCRQEGVFKGAVHLNELNILLRRSYPDYWEKRLRIERVERLRQAKEHWESKCQAFLGV